MLRECVCVCVCTSLSDLVSFLVECGADVNDPGGVHCGGVTPLIDAASSGHVEIVRLLVQSGANVFQKDAKVL